MHIQVKNGKLEIFNKKRVWYDSKQGFEYLHMILMNIFMEENPRVTYIEKKVRTGDIEFSTRDNAWQSRDAILFWDGVWQIFFFIHHKFASVAGSKNVQKNPRVTPIEKKLQRVTYQFK